VQLVPAALAADRVSPDADVGSALAELAAVANARLAAHPAAAFPEIQAWRRAFARMGLKPTQYRCASESLLRRFAKEGALPRIHPLVDLCNAVSLAFAVPVAAFDAERIDGDLEVRHATGSERYVSLSGEVEAPAPGEIVFADGAGRAHARRWTHRQSGQSDVRDDTRSALIVAEALHESARSDMERLVEALADNLQRLRFVTRSAILTSASPRFDR
jgi:DNA/RNA-binding domain of Phe-tRNA-synthetase-like protein